MADHKPTQVLAEYEEGRLRQPQGIIGKIGRVIAVFMVLYHLIYLTNFFDYVGIDVFITSEAHRALSLAFIMALTFLFVPMNKEAPRDRIPWYDAILLLASTGGSLYVFYFFQTKLMMIAPPTYLETIIGILLVIAIIEGVRRTVGLTVVIIILVSISYIFFGHYLSGMFYTRSYSVTRAIMQLIYSTEGVLGVPMHVTATIIFSFILFSRFLHVTGASKFFIDFALSLFGTVRGGPAKVAVVASSLFGTISGSAVANVVGTGVFTIPMMKKVGYKPHFAGAVEATASTGGQIMPPVMGSAAFIAAQFLEIPYVYFCIAAVVPAILYYLCVFLQVDLEAAKLGLKGLPSQELPQLKDTLRSGWHCIIPLVVLIYFLVVLTYSPVKAALYALGSLVIISMFKREIRAEPRRLLTAIEGGATGMIEIGAVCAGVGIVIGSVTLTGLGINLSTIIVDLSQGNLLALLILSAVACFILGMGVPTVPCYILVVLLVAPALIRLGVLPIVAHMFVFYMAMISMITPPVCLAAYVAAGLAGAPMMRTGFTATRLGIVALIVPFCFVYFPGLLLIGSTINIVEAVISALIGIISLAIGIEGYGLAELGWGERLLFLGGGLTLIASGLITPAIGIGILVPAVLWHLKKTRFRGHTKIQ